MVEHIKAIVVLPPRATAGVEIAPHCGVFGARIHVIAITEAKEAHIVNLCQCLIDGVSIPRSQSVENGVVAL